MLRSWAEGLMLESALWPVPIEPQLCVQSPQRGHRKRSLVVDHLVNSVPLPDYQLRIGGLQPWCSKLNGRGPESAFPRTDCAGDPSQCRPLAR